jgi:uncharacterized coiled-coil DUF342 family protein
MGDLVTQLERVATQFAKQSEGFAKTSTYYIQADAVRVLLQAAAREIKRLNRECQDAYGLLQEATREMEATREREEKLNE